MAHLIDDLGSASDHSGSDHSVPVVVDVDRLEVDGADGATWSLPYGGDLDANVVRLRAGNSIDAHVDAEVGARRNNSGERENNTYPVRR